MADPARKTIHIALLRGVNVGGHNKVPMKELAGVFTAAGCGEVSTYIQSGNVLYAATADLARRLTSRLPGALSKQFGFQVPVVVRTAEELRAVSRANPFQTAGTDPKFLYVAFLADAPDPSRVAALDPKRSPPDEFAVRGREVYLRFPNGGGRTKLTNEYFESKLGTTSTMRNWRTVLKLVALAGA